MNTLVYINCKSPFATGGQMARLIWTNGKIARVQFLKGYLATVPAEYVEAVNG